MKAYVYVMTIISAMMALSMIVSFGSNQYPLTRTLKQDDAAWLLFFRLALFIWGFTLLVRP